MTPDRITVAELQELLAAGQPVIVLDVRSPSEVDWEIPGSIHVDAYADLQSGRLGPLAELNLPPGPVVTVCGMGGTAAIATNLLRANGIEALTLAGGMPLGPSLGTPPKQGSPAVISSRSERSDPFMIAYGELRNVSPNRRCTTRRRSPAENVISPNSGY